MELLTAVFGHAAKDIKYYNSVGFPHALCIDDPDALQVALQIAVGRLHLLNNVDMFYSPPYLKFECPGYILFQDEEIAVDIQREIIRTGFECARAKACVIQPPPVYI